MLSKKHQQWLDANIQRIRKLENTDQYHKLLLTLYDTPDKRHSEYKQMAAVIRAIMSVEMTKEALEKAKAVAHRVGEKNRKERNRRMFDWAGLLILGGVLDGSSATVAIPNVSRYGDKANAVILGAVMQMSKMLELASDTELDDFMNAGFPILEARKLEKEARRAARQSAGNPIVPQQGAL